MNKTLVFFALFSFRYVFSLAEIFHINEESSFLCHFSLTEPNRICIEGGSVKKVFFNEGDLSVFLDEESGQVFVSPAQFDQKAKTLCVLSDQKKMQNLEIQFEEREAGIVILKDLLQKRSVLSDFDRIFEGYIPRDYEPSTKALPANKGTKGVYFRCLRAMEGKNETIFVWELSNLSRRVLILNEEGLRTPEDEYYILQKKRLAPSEKTLAISATRREPT